MPSRSLQQNKRHGVRGSLGRGRSETFEHFSVGPGRPCKTSWTREMTRQQLGLGHTNTPPRSDQPTGGRGIARELVPTQHAVGLAAELLEFECVLEVCQANTRSPGATSPRLQDLENGEAEEQCICEEGGVLQ